MGRAGQFLAGTAVSGSLGLLMLQAHALSQAGIAFHLRTIGFGHKSFKEYDYNGSVLAAVWSTRAWNRLVLDVHAKLLEYWSK
mmetsp:Transcript_104386/g.295603  ORF Transcript_104386/g.295603 Transcript_104386/m.295603 type:complete len:83 (+) Transcript_104386:49-297(+)